MTKIRFFLFLLLGILLTHSCGDSGTEPNNPETKIPVIKKISPEEIYSNEIFSIIGENFDTLKPKVFVNEQEASVVSWSDTLIKAKIIISEGKYPVYIKTDTIKSNSKEIIIKPAPVEPVLQITSVTPDSAFRGDIIEISGTLFGDSQNDGKVEFNGIKVIGNDYISWTDNLIKCKVPENIPYGYCEIRVITLKGQSNNYSFTVIEPALQPTITSISPKSGIKIGSQVTIDGKDFGSTQLESSYLMLNTIKITNVIFWTDSQIKFNIPEGAVSGNIKVVAKNFSSNLYKITIEKDEEEPPQDDPEIISLSVNEIPLNGGTQIIGKNFGSNIGKVFLEGNIEAAGIQKWTNTEIRITIPSKVKSGELYIITADGKTSNKIKYYIKVVDMVKMVLVQSGSFIMGDNATDNNSEKPEHKVTISRNFYVSETEITQKQYKRYVSQNMFVPKNTDEAPANNLSFIEVCQFCNILSNEVGLDSCYIINGSNIVFNYRANGYRLLTDAEWEYAARAGSESKWGFIDGSIGDYAWYSDNYSLSYPALVKQKKANKWGLYDMSGNVEEWVWDYSSWDYYGESHNSIDPTGPTTGQTRILRGGSYNSVAAKCKTTSKSDLMPTQKSTVVGFRIARNQ